MKFTIDELLGTKLRALYQRKKGRDLFDSWMCKSQLEVDPDKVVHCFLEYMDRSGLKVSRAQFEQNLTSKLEDPAFEEDIKPLLKQGTSYNFKEAAEYVRSDLIARLPGSAWKSI